MHGLRRAFSALSDVLIEEVDLIRSEANARNEEMQQRMMVQAKALKLAKTELTLLRNETQTGRATQLAKSAALEERLDAMQDDNSVLAKVASTFRRSAFAGAGRLGALSWAVAARRRRRPSAAAPSIYCNSKSSSCAQSTRRKHGSAAQRRRGGGIFVALCF